MKTLVVAAVATCLLLSSAAAQAPASPIGLWRVADGSAIIRVKPCGKAICGYVAAAPAPAPGATSAVGKKILVNLRQDGAVWRGIIFNIDDGKTYSGEVSLNGDRLKVKGCLPNGFCGGEMWRRE
ncbi:hypothetical protein CCR94_07625 [Rhodoblastus sphagnicola]|uniref:Uncharacterized protein n=1 Tax=Rhodoblastus sphagnicola TaxID=333368 RepID=A0A2S6NBG7_9HYPH|nr:DUF2147 domain-containing protein [Rhodoblastus sphagnicola]MBB4197060.1 uncharacterized protein (DUF2147 family) [Rhodoblastus sphagnicola]PPQ31956.1 hypothetical protein CCR94_07625 [Rhodoblastus sphagnicola]